MKEKKHINDLADLIVHHAYQFFLWKCYAAMKQDEKLPSGYYNYDQEQMDKIINKADALLKTTQQTRKIQAQSIKDITDNLKKGIVTTDEAIKLLKIVEHSNDNDFSL